MQPEPETGLAVLGRRGIGLVAQAAEAAVQEGGKSVSSSSCMRERISHAGPSAKG